MASNLLPPNATTLERSLAGVAEIINEIPLDIASLWNPQTCAAELLPWLAWALSTDNWSPGWSNAQKRAAVASAIEDQRHKGTRHTVQSVLSHFDSLLTLVEWFEQTPAADPYTFEVRLSLIDADGVAGGDRVSAAFAREIVQAVSAAKPVRAHFILVQQLELIGTPSPFAAVQATGYRRLEFDTSDGDSGIPWSDLLQTETGEPITDNFGETFDGSAP